MWNPISEPIASVDLPVEVLSYIEEVLRVYGIESAYALERMTHHEDPWALARGNIPHDEESVNVISKKSMASYFLCLVHEEN